MLEILAYIALLLAILVGAVAVMATRRPDNFRFARTARIAATPERLFPLIADLHQMNTWNPYALRDPASTGRYSGPASGRGAKYEFAGKKSGTGHIEIVDAKPNSEVVMRLFMTKPFACDNRVDFTLKPEGPATTVTWAMSGQQPLMAKFMTLFINCENMVGKDFDEGLGNLKAIAEKG
jgi:uncharacterized protein YndB with AHSA1/START domain